MGAKKVVRCASCNRRKYDGERCACKKSERFYVPDVDGTLGTYAERINGGPTVDHDGNLVTNAGDFEPGSRFKS